MGRGVPQVWKLHNLGRRADGPVRTEQILLYEASRVRTKTHTHSQGPAPAAAPSNKRTHARTCARTHTHTHTKGTPPPLSSW